MRKRNKFKSQCPDEKLSTIFYLKFFGEVEQHSIEAKNLMKRKENSALRDTKRQK